MKTVCEQAVLAFGTRLCARSTSRSGSEYFMLLENFQMLRLILLTQNTAAVQRQTYA